jgi:hypothetical protein
MPDLLPELLDSRSHLLRELSQLGDFQPPIRKPWLEAEPN